MLRKLRSRLTYANVVATLALFVALGGTAYAVNTVGSTDIIDGEVKSVDVGDGEIGSSDVKDNSLNTFDVHSFVSADVVDGSLTGADIQDNSVSFLDIGSEQVGSDEVVNDSLLQSDIRAGAVTNDEVLNNTLISADIQDGSLNDEDIGQGTFVNFTANIGIVPAHGCASPLVTGVNARTDHLLLTAGSDQASYLSYTPVYFNDGNMAIKACNPSATEIDDGTTHFNLLVIDAQ